MLSELFGNVLSSYKSLFGTGSILVLFVVGVFALLLLSQGDEKKIAPLTLVLSSFGAIGAFVAKIITVKDEKVTRLIRALILVACVFVIVVSGKRILSPVFLEKSENSMHIPSGLKETMDIMLEGSGDDTIGVVSMPGYGNYFEGYSTRFKLIYEEPYDGDVVRVPDEYKEAYLELCKTYPDMRIVARAARNANCKYIVVLEDAYWPQIPLTELSYEVVGGSGGFVIYEDMEGAK